MKIKIILYSILLLLLLLFAMCKKKDNIPLSPPEGAINLSLLTDKHDYYLPFSIINDNPDVKTVVLNDKALKFSLDEFIEFNENGFYSLVLKYNSKQQDDTFLFTTITKDRENSEWGIKAWVPAQFKTVLLGSESVDAIYPHRYADGVKIPFIFYVRESGLVKSIYCQGKFASTTIFNIKKGVGSVNIASSILTETNVFNIGGKSISTPLAKITEEPLLMSGTISTHVIVPANSFVKIQGTLNLTSSGSLTIQEGTVIIADEAVDINLSGPLIISGSAAKPVFFTCSEKDKSWGGFITRTSGGTIDAKYAIFCQSGFHNTEGYNWGHAGRQALFYTENSTLTLNHCYMIDNIGQIFYPQNATLNLNNILVQRAYTGGQINTSQLTLLNSVFADFPDDSNTFADEDNDALYLSASDANIENTVFMYAKDDGLDSGNTQGGNIVVTNSTFEACFHEGAALSSGNGENKNHTFRSCIFTNCGQGIELGFSSPNHFVLADNCQFLNNGVGIRYGDNYDWSEVDGFMIIKNSFSLNNDRDVWNMVHMNWSPKIDNLSFENTTVSHFCPQYPQLPVKP